MELQSKHPSHIPCGNNITNKRANVCGEKKKSIFKLSGVSSASVFNAIIPIHLFCQM